MPLLRGLFLEGRFNNLVPRALFPGFGEIGDLTEGFLRYEFGGLIFGGAYFQNFTTLFGFYGNKNLKCFWTFCFNR